MEFIGLLTALTIAYAAPASLPLTSVVGILTTQSGGDVRVCSGVLVARTLVLTAAHCVPRDAVELGATLVTSLESVDFLQSARDPESMLALLATSIDVASPVLAVWHDASPEAWKKTNQPWSLIEHDLGLLELAHSLPGTDIAVLARLNANPGKSVAASHVGYSTLTRKVTPQQIYASQAHEFFFSRGPLAPGDSGGPIFAEIAGQSRVVGIASVLDRFGSADFARVSAEVLERVQGPRLSTSIYIGAMGRRL